MSADIIWLCDHRAKAETNFEIDLRTAVDVAIRDLQDIEANWGTELGHERLMECLKMQRYCLQVCDQNGAGVNWRE